MQIHDILLEVMGLFLKIEDINYKFGYRKGEVGISLI
jgi:hypothetical protein